MSGNIQDDEVAIAAVFNSAIGAAAIGAAWDIGLLDEVKTRHKVDIDDFVIRHDLDQSSMHGLVLSLNIIGVLERDNEIVLPGRLLDEAYRTKSLFHWLTLGSGGLFSRMQYALRNEYRSGSFYSRDPEAIAYACRDINRQHFDPTFWTAMDRLDYKFHTVVDLGSGSGERLMQMLNRHAGTLGIGVDIAGAVITSATAHALEKGLDDRLSFIEGDVRQMVYQDQFAQVDLLTCFMMGHDFWPRENCVSTLRSISAAFPKARRFLLGDTTRVLLDNPCSKYAVNGSNVPIFTLGFEFGHALMGAYLPTMEEWDDVFTEGGWRCMNKYLLQSPSQSVIFELEKM